MTAYDVRAIVVNWNGAHLLKDCVASLGAQTGVRVETLIVDNGSKDDSAAVASQLAARFLPLGANRGLAMGYNEGARGADALYLFFVNNDMRFAENCVSRLVAAYAGRSDLFAADPRHYCWAGDRVTHGAQRLVRDARSSFAALPGVRPFEELEVAAPTEIPWGCAGALLVERKKFEALGGFDASFFFYMEDVDLCLRAWTRGWATLHVPQAMLYHHVSASHGPNVRRSGSQLRHFLNRMRIAISIQKNAQRTALKLLPPRELTRLVPQTLRICADAVVVGRPLTPAIVALALFANGLDATRILAERRSVRRDASRSLDEILARFIS